MTIDQFQGFLERDLSWRKLEISHLFMIFDSVENKEVISKSMILLLYAHWEGFIKKSSKYYIKYVSERKIRIKDLTLNFRAIVLKKFAADCIKNNSLTLSQELSFINKHDKMLEKKFKIDINVDDEFDESLIDTQHNLSSKVLKNIMDIVGSSYNDAIKTRANYFDVNLIKNRNAIGHGNKIGENDADVAALGFSEIVKLKDFVLSMLDYYADILFTYVTDEFYLISKTAERNEYEERQETELNRKLEQIESRVLNN